MSKPKPWDTAWTTEPSKNYEAMRAWHKAYDAARYAKLIAEHRCVRCREVMDADETRRRCGACRATKAHSKKYGDRRECS